MLRVALLLVALSLAVGCHREASPPTSPAGRGASKVNGPEPGRPEPRAEAEPRIVGGESVTLVGAKVLGGEEVPPDPEAKPGKTRSGQYMLKWRDWTVFTLFDDDAAAKGIGMNDVVSVSGKITTVVAPNREFYLHDCKIVGKPRRSN